MKIVMFYHSLLSDWNHGNAHFLRGVVADLKSRGHAVTVYEPADSWSLANLLADEGEAALQRGFRDPYPGLDSTRYDAATLDLDAALADADLVLVHEWNDPALVAAIGRHKRRGGRYPLLFHDTHHRAVSAPREMARFDLSAYDGALVFGEVLRDVYATNRWAARTWTWHEAADPRVFHPLAPDVAATRYDGAGDLVWVGNWGDGERTAELHEFLIDPVKQLGLTATVHGVRYPDSARKALADAGIRYGGYLPNALAPAAFARHKVTVHVPRRPYATALKGIPTIRVFEALACGIPLVSAPWDDAEHLFTPGRDFAVARDGAEMADHLAALVADEPSRRALADHGLSTVLARHTCARRVEELLGVADSL